MAEPWAQDELGSLQLNDKRLDRRLVEVLSMLAARPTASIPAACGGNAELAAAYRLFDNDKVSFDKILLPHIESTRRRIADQNVVIAVQDTTEIDLSRPASRVKGAGPLDGDTRRGLLMHMLHAFTEDGTPLGTLAARTWTRVDNEPAASALTRARRAALPIERKESHRWVRTMRRVREEAERFPTVQFIAVADSEADIYEMLVQSQAEPRKADWIIRACQDRVTLGVDDATSGLRERLLSSPVSYTDTFVIRSRAAKVSCEKQRRKTGRQSRKAEVEVRAATVTLRPPYRSDRKLPEVTVNVARVRESDPPAGEEPLEWLLLTSLPIAEVAEVRRVVRTYASRWMVEVLFKTLKSGCRVEERRFEDVKRHLPCLAVYLIVAWRTLFVCRMGRSCPDVSCEVIFEPEEWKAVYQVVHRRPPPKEPPPLGKMVRLVARLGGYVDRPKGAPPGPQTVWLGIQRAYDFGLAWRAFGPETTDRAKDV